MNYGDPPRGWVEVSPDKLLGVLDTGPYRREAFVDAVVYREPAQDQGEDFAVEYPDGRAWVRPEVARGLIFLNTICQWRVALRRPSYTDGVRAETRDEVTIKANSAEEATRKACRRGGSEFDWRDHGWTVESVTLVRIEDDE